VTTWVGRSLPRTEDDALVRGAGRFVADLPTEWHARFVRSTVAAGRIRSVSFPPDATAFSASDLGDAGEIRPALHRPDYVVTAQPLLASDVVRFAGEPIAVVLARTAAVAEDLADAVVVDYDVGQAVLDTDAATAFGAPVVHEVPGGFEPNTVIDAHFATAGVEAAFGSAAHVVEVTVRSDRQSAMPLEARGSVAEFDRRTGRTTLTSSTQAPHIVRTAIAGLLRMPERDLRVVAPDVGGAFGQKLALAREDAVLVWVARRLRTSVAWIEDRLENFTSAFHSRQHRYTVRGAFDGQGTILGLDADIVCNVGAYSCYPFTCGVEPLMAMAELPGPYRVGEYRARARAVVTNTCPIAPYRGVSRPVLTLAVERLMDTAAAELDLDPVDIRLRNLLADFPHKTPTGMVIDEGSYREVLGDAVLRIDLPALRARQRELRDVGRYLGIGLATFAERTGYGTTAFAARHMDITPGYEEVELSMDPDGMVELRIGASPHGQGLATSLAQVVADQLGVTPHTVRVLHGDTDRDPYGWGTFASRSMVLAGGAAVLAGGRLRERICAIAAELLEASPHDLSLVDGRAVVNGTSIGVDLREVARTFFLRRRLAGDVESLTVRATYDPHGTFSNACHVAVVEVDVETGQVDLQRFLVIEDAGLLVNPMIAEGQIHGGVCQGIANALYEGLQYDQQGTLMTASLMDYLTPTMAEIPEIEIHHRETLTDATLLGAKGLGEGGAIGAPAAVVNAINDALRPLGVIVNHMPVTPGSLRALLRDREREPRTR
jgi:aerobic carbon-monoxide dehydrogenase large subunit